ncbi:hypothetical protein Pres01_42900 [Metapseudomonas resinovorans]|uniref:DUF2931 family protein n=1 Tax=Metapseudomonas resinovorans TaxID=53412 RepID=UPI000987792B|nr:DUF2931 family protein [Pseudomonas resinovorans]GLZ88239.1 hypothetical protein Pres01_42900 [Pseudomonas resinovorans]
MRHFLLIGLLLVGGCQSMDPLSGAQDDHNPWWSLGFAHPAYMKVWVEDSAVVDIRGRLFRNTGRGIAAGDEPEDGTEAARGWRGGAGPSGVAVVGADLPRHIYVRWQSIVEPQTYRAWVDIPEEARQIMRDSIAWRCPQKPDRVSRYRASLYLGLAPGGIIQVWVYNRCYRSVKVARAKAEVEPLGPHLGQSGGHYYPLSDASERYIERFGIPYGSW